MAAELVGLAVKVQMTLVMSAGGMAMLTSASKYAADPIPMVDKPPE